MFQACVELGDKTGIRINLASLMISLVVSLPPFSSLADSFFSTSSISCSVTGGCSVSVNGSCVS